MSPILFDISLVALGFGLGVLAMVIRNKLSVEDADQMDDVPSPLDAAEYADWLEGNRVRYRDAMAQYDKLIPWASGGALVVSLSFVSSLAAVAPSWSKWILGFAWLLLVGSLLSSILSQYSSTRIQVWAKIYMNLRQTPPEAEPGSEDYDKWRNETLEFERKSRRSGRNTKALNVLGGILLVAGLLTLGVFGIAAVPFGSGIQP